MGAYNLLIKSYAQESVSYKIRPKGNLWDVGHSLFRNKEG